MSVGPPCEAETRLRGCQLSKRNERNRPAELSLQFCKGRSVSHEHRQRRVRQDMAGCAAQDHLPQTALRVGAFYEKVAAERLGAREDGFARSAGRVCNLLDLDRYAVPPKRSRQVL